MKILRCSLLNNNSHRLDNLNKIFPVVLTSLICCISFLCITACKANNNDNISNGQGGYESPVLPNFSDSVPPSSYDAGSIIDDGEFRIEDFMSVPSESSTSTDSTLSNSDNVSSTENTTISTADNDQLFYISYRVKEGDIIGALAEKFDVTSDTIISVNSIKQSRLIQIGQYLKIPSMAGILYTVRNDNETINDIAKKYDVEVTKCALANNLSETVSLSAGTTLFVPDAALDWVTRQEINGDLFIRPLKGGYTLTSYFGWRSSPFTGVRSYHNGVDMAAAKGTSIYAALAGTVTTAGWSNTYGNYVIITHHSGYKTLYGHMSEILVKRGQVVYTTTRIGRVGSTGLSTGPHLHFTVYKNNVAINPQNLWN